MSNPNMFRPKLEVADIFRRHGEAWRTANAGHVNLTQWRVMTAIEICRTAALGGHVDRCQDCAHTRIAYNSCRNRNCPKCQWPTAAAWLAAREAELLPVPYFHMVFKLPAAIGAIAYQRRRALWRVPVQLGGDGLAHRGSSTASLYRGAGRTGRYVIDSVGRYHFDRSVVENRVELLTEGAEANCM
jgi:hypothetical protein